MSNFDNIHMFWPNTTPETLKKIQFYHNLDIQSRGAFLIQSNWIESDIDGILSLTFCGNHKSNIHLMRSTILKRLSFDAKIQSLNKIINLRYKNIATNNEKFKSKLDNLANNLETVKKFRNKLAHSTLDISDAFLEKDTKDRIPIKSYDYGKEKYLDIPIKEIESKLILTTDISIALKLIIKHISSELNVDSKKS